MIEVKNLVKYYDDGAVKAVDDISFVVGKGDIVGFVGPNGAGKSTTLRMLTGYTVPSSGIVNINGINILDSGSDAKQNIGYLPESAALYQNMKLIEFLNFIVEARSLPKCFAKERINYVIDKLGLKEKANQTIGSLSKGYRQRVGLAQAIIHDPEIIILDEPTSGLDPNQVMEIRKLIQEISSSKTVIFSTHALREVEAVCSKVIILNRGKVALCANKDELESVRSKNITRVVLKGDSNISKVFRDADQFRVVKEKEEEGNVTLILESLFDIRGAVFELAQQNNFVILEFFLEKESLEKIFKSLTR